MIPPSPTAVTSQPHPFISHTLNPQGLRIQFFLADHTPLPHSPNSTKPRLPLRRVSAEAKANNLCPHKANTYPGSPLLSKSKGRTNRYGEMGS